MSSHRTQTSGYLSLDFFFKENECLFSPLLDRFFCYLPLVAGLICLCGCWQGGREERKVERVYSLACQRRKLAFPDHLYVPGYYTSSSMCMTFNLTIHSVIAQRRQQRLKVCVNHPVTQLAWESWWGGHWSLCSKPLLSRREESAGCC